MKFKVGDKVRILPSAADDGIDPVDIGKEAIVIDGSTYSSMYIKMIPAKSHGWWIDGDNLVPVIKIGQQLQFPFMQTGG